MSFLVRRAAFFGTVWGVGDFFAQFYSAHQEAAARRARGEKRDGPRPSGAQMLALLDKERLAQSFVFGLVAGAFLAQYERSLPRIFGRLTRSATSCLCALSLQQVAVTPLLLWSYFNAMTAVRGGLADPSFMNAHDAGAYQRNDVASVERHILKGVMPYPLLTAWGVYTPLFIFAYVGPFKGATFLSGCLFVPWCGLLSYTQDNELL
ncbi:hypothetical protein ABB37_01826 [Leptomonas pyrrhocoris]|uniref:Uncharacterized protein n=1 Tax=Leptomonas pyrrhocoris TaxID=157538 RepID=A0A0N0VHJ6_LEPPY|nr:hypothetical protein ABB37_01826 [Leptomonas pyrrhocoris]XP_015664001.1 hypothetical protein ABB37_01826 [Leptomonas pyrrhocoris]KPA85561.1 hypothetical protein ABB37_01826 [Leptomonas pyrrhocoris]KPA85562.1 hypothetical protein ABB37_01826 [Leptomonas pyrrhocoris]|eukprot:XP_015664000.1 hypothetical protein ABB37_01826 [Leptomonas pyrrhocoris]